MIQKANTVPRKLTRVWRVRIEGGEIVLHGGLFRSWKVRPADISSLTIQPVFSLFDEIGVVMEAEKNFFLREEIPGFNELSEIMDFNQIFGEDWYQRAESGEFLRWTKSEELR